MPSSRALSNASTHRIFVISSPFRLRCWMIFNRASKGVATNDLMGNSPDHTLVVLFPIPGSVSQHARANRISSASGRKLPYWPGSLYKAHLEPAAKEVGIVGHFGWHTFRHTYATLLKGNGEDVKVVQELMRHANISMTLNIYAQAITQSKRDAQSRVVSLLLDKNEEKPSTEAYRTLTDVQNSGGDLQVVDKVGVPSGADFAPMAQFILRWSRPVGDRRVV